MPKIPHVVNGLLPQCQEHRDTTRRNCGQDRYMVRERGMKRHNHPYNSGIIRLTVRTSLVLHRSGEVERLQQRRELRQIFEPKRGPTGAEHYDWIRGS